MWRSSRHIHTNSLKIVLNSACVEKEFVLTTRCLHRILEQQAVPQPGPQEDILRAQCTDLQGNSPQTLRHTSECNEVFSYTRSEDGSGSFLKEDVPYPSHPVRHQCQQVTGHTQGGERDRKREAEEKKKQGDVVLKELLEFGAWLPLNPLSLFTHAPDTCLAPL